MSMGVRPLLFIYLLCSFLFAETVFISSSIVKGSTDDHTQSILVFDVYSRGFQNGFEIRTPISVVRKPPSGGTVLFSIPLYLRYIDESNTERTCYVLATPINDNGVTVTRARISYSEFSFTPKNNQRIDVTYCPFTGASVRSLCALSLDYSTYPDIGAPPCSATSLPVTSFTLSDIKNIMTNNHPEYEPYLYSSPSFSSLVFSFSSSGFYSASSQICFPLVILFGILSLSLFIAGKNPLSGFDLSAPRLNRGIPYQTRLMHRSISLAALPGVAAGTITYFKEKKEEQRKIDEKLNGEEGRQRTVLAQAYLENIAQRLQNPAEEKSVSRAERQLFARYGTDGRRLAEQQIRREIVMERDAKVQQSMGRWQAWGVPAAFGHVAHRVGVTRLVAQLDRGVNRSLGTTADPSQQRREQQKVSFSLNPLNPAMRMDGTTINPNPLPSTLSDFAELIRTQGIRGLFSSFRFSSFSAGSGDLNPFSTILRPFWGNVGTSYVIREQASHEQGKRVAYQLHAASQSFSSHSKEDQQRYLENLTQELQRKEYDPIRKFLEGGTLSPDSLPQFISNVSSHGTLREQELLLRALFNAQPHISPLLQKKRMAEENGLHNDTKAYDSTIELFWKTWGGHISTHIPSREALDILRQPLLQPSRIRTEELGALRTSFSAYLKDQNGNSIDIQSLSPAQQVALHNLLVAREGNLADDARISSLAPRIIRGEKEAIDEATEIIRPLLRDSLCVAIVDAYRYNPSLLRETLGLPPTASSSDLDAALRTKSDEELTAELMRISIYRFVGSMPIPEGDKQHYLRLIQRGSPNEVRRLFDEFVSSTQLPSESDPLLSFSHYTLTDIASGLVGTKSSTFLLYHVRQQRIIQNLNGQLSEEEFRTLTDPERLKEFLQLPQDSPYSHETLPSIFVALAQKYNLQLRNGPSTSSPESTSPVRGEKLQRAAEQLFSLCEYERQKNLSLQP